MTNPCSAVADINWINCEGRHYSLGGYVEIQNAITTKQVKRAFSRLGFSLCAILALATLFQILLTVGVAIVEELVMAPWNDFEIPDWVQWLVIFLPIYLVGMPVGYLLMKKVPATSAEPQKLGGKQFWLYALMCMPLMYGGNVIGSLMQALLSGGQASSGIEILALDTSPLKVVFLVILAPIFEEFIFRKQLIDRTVCYGEKTAVLFSALMFALFHTNIQQFFYALGLGWIFGYVYLKTCDLRYSTLLHIMVNFLGTVVAPLVMSLCNLEADDSGLFGDMTGLWPMVIYGMLLISLSIAGLVVLIAYRKNFIYQPTELELPKGNRFKVVYCNAGVIVFALLSVAIGLMLMSL